MQNTHSSYICLLWLVTGVSLCMAARRTIVMDGETVTLTCPINMTRTPVEWRDPRGYDMLHYKENDERIKFMPSTSSFSVQISNVTFTDEGVYKCLIYSKSKVFRKRIQLIVLSAPKLETERHLNKTVVKCSTSANGNTFRLSWLMDKDLEVEALHTTVANKERTHSAISHLHVRTHRRLTTVKCLVRYSSLHGFTLNGSIILENNDFDESATPAYPSYIDTLTKMLITDKPFTHSSSTTEEASTIPEIPQTTPRATETPTISTLAPHFSTAYTIGISETESSNTQEPEVHTNVYDTTDSSSGTTEITDAYTISSNSTGNETSESQYQSTTVGPTNTSEYTTPSPTLNNKIYNTTDSESGITPYVASSNVSTTSSNNSSVIKDENRNEGRRSENGNSVLLVILVTCLIFCLIIVLAFILIRLRKAHTTWKKENEDTDQSVESSKSKSSNEEKQKQKQQKRGPGLWNVSFTKYKEEDPIENEVRATAASVHVINEKTEKVNGCIAKPIIKETEL